MSAFLRDSGPEEGRGRRGPSRGGPPRRTPPTIPPGRPFRTLAFWAFVVLLAIVTVRIYQGSFMAPQRLEVTYTRFIQEVDKGNILNLQILDHSVTGELKNEASLRVGGRDINFKAFKTNIAGEGADLPDRVWKANPGIDIDYRSGGLNWLSLLLGWLPAIMLFGAWLFIMRQMQAGGSAALKFGKTRARVLLESQPKVTFKDVAGCDEAKYELQEIIEFLKEPQKFQRLGGRIPKGALLLGPPGSGKTLLAKAVAGEAGVPFFSMSGSDFVEMFVGVGASRVRDLFEQGKRNAPCLTGDAVVTLSGGRQVTIREMFENAMVGVKVPAMSSEDFRLEDATVLGITRKPSKDLYEVRTSTSAVKATGNHLFPVLRAGGMEWIRADALTSDDYVAVPRVIPTPNVELPFASLLPTEDVVVRFRGEPRGRRRTRLFEILPDLRQRYSEIESISLGGGGFRSSSLSRFPLSVSEDLAYLCGLIASDGSFGRRGDRTIPFVNTERVLHERVSEILQREFGYSPRLRLNAKHFENLLPQGKTPQSLRDCWTSYINNRLLCDALRSLNTRVLEMRADLIAAWLRGVFDGDGHVRVCSNSPRIIISAWNGTANQRIRDALLRVGIPTSLSERAHAGSYGNIELSGVEAVRRFANRVWSHHPAKQLAMDQLLNLLQDRDSSSSRLDAVPVGGLLRRAQTSIGMSQRDFQRGHVVSAYERVLHLPSRKSLQSVLAEMETWRERNGGAPTFEFEKLSDVAESAVLWARVCSVMAIPAGEPVYDLCLDRHNCFVANNIIVHNCIIFIDEIDAVGRHRGAGLGGGHDEREQTLNQLLVEMDGFDSNEGVIMIAATNRPDVLDPALLRPGRFDRQIVVDWPDVRGREGILRVHTRRIPLADDVDLAQIARSTPGLAGADLANLVNESALLAARRNRKKVTARDFEDAKDKVMLGMERKSLVMTEEERRTTAYHEAGHALVALLQPGIDPVDKVTIIPRGRALGVTSYVPSEERHNRSKEDLVRRLCTSMGGRAAEYLIFNHFTTGAANDIEQATTLARRMVCEFGMSERLGPLTFGKKEEMVFLGREISSHKDYSEQTAVAIDEEVRLMVEGAFTEALDLLRKHIDKLHLIANSLLEREVLDRDEMDRLMRGEKLDPPKAAAETEAGEAARNPEAAPARGSEGLEPFGPPTPRPAGA